METLMRALILFLVSCGLTAAAPVARSDAFPSETVRIIVPYAAGGIADVLARLVGTRMEAAFRQPVIVENKAGANGTIAQQFVAGAKPDGYTLLLGNTSTQVVNAHLYTKLPINIAKAFQPIGLIAASPMMLVVSASSPASNVADLLAAARASAAPLNFGSAGNGSASHLSLVLLATQGKVSLNHVPYKGTAQIAPDLIGGRLDAYFDVPITAMPLLKSGKLKAIGVASRESQPALPGVAPIAATLPGFEMTTWLGLFGPAGVPKERVDRLNRTLATILSEPALRQQLIDQGNEVRAGTAAEFESFIASEMTRIGEVIRAAGIKLD
jgi:tripartite-type tricarboxylate transporter receptor subunit TctC